MTQRKWYAKALYTVFVLALVVSMLGMGSVISAKPKPIADNPDLSSIFDTQERTFLLDENEDGFTDALNTSIVLPQNPTAGESAAAVNIAVRLGFETMGMDLPLAMPDTAVGEMENPILIGRSNRLLSEIERSTGKRLEPLKSGQGAIQAVPWAGSTAVLVGGLNDAGTLAVGEYFAGRLPYVWQVGEGNLTLSDVKAAVALYLKDFNAEDTSISRVVAEDGKAGLAQVWVDVTLLNKKVRSAAHQALQELKDSHAQGEAWDQLNYERIGKLVISVYDGDKWVKTILPNQGGLPASEAPTLSSPEANAYDLSSLYGSWDELMEKTEGLLGDTPESKPFLEAVGILVGEEVKDFIPDTIKATIVVGGSAAAIGAANFAGRLGLETIGINLPLAQTIDQIANAEEILNPVLFGASNLLVQQLEAADKVNLATLGDGQGMVSVIPEAFGDYHALVVAGQDDEGTAAAADYAARRLPYLWEPERGYTTMTDIEDAVKDFFAVKSAGGQAAEAVLKIDELVAGLSASDIIDLTVYLDLPLGVHEDEAFATFLENRIEGELPGLEANVAVKAMKDPSNVFTYEWADEGELAEFRGIYGAVAGAIGDGADVEIEVRLSEPPEMLDALQAELQAGAPNAEVTVISAYKQGFSWLNRVVRPAIEGNIDNVGEVTIYFQEFYEDGINADNWELWKNAWNNDALTWMDMPTRWLHEIYPIDDVWQNELGIDRDNVIFEQIVKTDPDIPLTGSVYVVNVTFTDGSPTYVAEFTPTYDERDYHVGTTVKNWKVHPTTGWVKVTKGDATLLDQRIKTDPERYWDYFQDTIWPAMRDYVLAITEGSPTTEKQPFFLEIKHEVWMSDPNYRLDVREELISSLEALYEDIYFITLDYFTELRGSRYPSRYTAPGQILPWIHDGELGSAPSATVTLNALNSKVPRIVLQVEDGPTFDVVLTGASVERPQAMQAIVNDGANELAGLKLNVVAATEEAQTKAVDMLAALSEVHAAGAITEHLSWPKLGELTVEVAGPLAPQSVALPKVTTVPSGKVIGPTTGITLPTEGSIVQWEHPIGYEESNAILAELDERPEINVWLGGKSYQGRNVFVADVMLPVETELWSQAKASTWKPTFYLVMRQHANEVSSTNEGLRLIEMLSNDPDGPDFLDYLKRVNIVLVPYWNADGATIAYELQLEQPYWMHHAGRYNAGGTDVPNHAFNPDTPWTEALVVTKGWQTWLPDEYLNHHGYPSHEWVQQFGGYTPPAYLAYWISRGHYFSNRTIRGPSPDRIPVPEGAAVADAVKAGIYAQLATQPDLMAFNQVVYAQYDKYGADWWPNIFRTEFMGPEDNKLMMYTRTSGVNPFSNSYTSGYPWITLGTTGTEIMDETPHGYFMDQCARAHFYVDIAILNVYSTADHNLGRSVTEVDGVLYLTTSRTRPVTPTP